MDIYIQDIGEYGELNYQIAGCSGDQAEALLKRFGGLRDFSYNKETEYWECDHIEYSYWAEAMLDMEELFTRLISFRKKFGDEVINAIAERSLEYTDIEEVIGAHNSWLDRVSWIDIKKDGEYFIAYECEISLDEEDSSEIGHGVTAEEAIINYIKKSTDN